MAINAAFTEDALRDLAGARSFTRGQGYLDAVTDLEVTAGGVTAIVHGQSVYEVTLTMDAGKGLFGDCDCPYGLDGNFCKHCVAVGLVVLNRHLDLPEEQAAAASRGTNLEAWLEALPRDRLLGLLREQLAEDRALRRRLEVRAAAEQTADDIDTAALRPRIMKLLDSAPFGRYGYVEYADVSAYAAQAGEAVDALRSLTATGRAPAAVTMAREAIGRLCQVYEEIDDSSGAVGEVAADLEQVHREACSASGADPIEAAEWLAAHMLGDWSHLPEIDLDGYWDMLGHAGRGRFGELVAEASQRDESGWAVRYLKQEIARVEGDVDALVVALATDLAPYGQTHLTIAEELDRAGRSAEALAWAERGLRETAPHPFGADGLADYVAGRYERDGRLADTVTIRRERLRTSPSLIGYQCLRAAARKAGCWHTERPDALDLLRDKESNRETDSLYYGSLLVEALTDDKDIDAAWQAAEGRANDRQWLALADLVRDERPADSLNVYQRAIETCTRLTGNGNYREIARLLLLARDCHRRLDTEHDFTAYVADLRAAQRRKRNLMKILGDHGL